MSERQNLHVYLEQKAALAVQGKSAAQRRLPEVKVHINIIFFF